MTKKFIIGGGISGLIWKYYNPEFQIISPEVGGLYAKSYLVWLHDCVETRRLLTDLGWPAPELYIKKSPIGYYHHGWISNFLTDEVKLLMIQKKMTNWNEPVNKDFVPRTRDMSLSSGILEGVNYMNTLDVDLNEIIKRLNEKADVLEGLVTQITEDKILVKSGDNETWFEYDKLISTIPAPHFWKAWGQERDFKCLPITNIIVNEKPKVFDDRYEMVYYDDSVPFSRISHIQDKYAIEFTGVITKEAFEEEFPEFTIVDYFVVKQGRIFGGEENRPPSEKITFSGRFAQWEYGITTEFIISQSLEYHDKSKTT